MGFGGTMAFRFGVAMLPRFTIAMLKINRCPKLKLFWKIELSSEYFGTLRIIGTCIL